MNNADIQTMPDNPRGSTRKSGPWTEVLNTHGEVVGRFRSVRRSVGHWRQYQVEYDQRSGPETPAITSPCHLGPVLGGKVKALQMESFDLIKQAAEADGRW